MNYATVCSGIEAPSVAWHGLGWNPVFFSEIEPFPCAVLKHYYPKIPNLGDMKKFQGWPDYAIDLICGGTPCQSFSVAGLRKGLDDPRGNLTLVYLGILQRYRPRWMVWENVPGVLSDKTGAFGAFLGGLGQFGYGFAYRVLDAQYAGVPQRRRRVFVIGCLGSWQCAAAVLFERHSFEGHTPPSRKAGESIAANVAPSLTGSGRGVERTGESRGQDPVIALHGTQDPCTSEVAFAEGRNSGQENIIAHSLNSEGFDASDDGAGRGTSLVAGCLQERDAKGADSDTKPGHLIVSIAENQRGEIRVSETMPTLAVAGGKPGSGYPAIGVSSDDVMYSCTARDQHGIQSGMQVRRLTPRECERLQGFADDYTLVDFRGKQAADGPRYKALGNSMAVPVIRWIGKRIQMVEDLCAK
ncbi:MAG: DNA cytosine methyltransferase [Thiothrix sp.]|uniref:DNA cytosine methyltransferase n=1 Tax=Thiothrix sp. TaxID=1032 RepID=UPI002601ED6E|nr:DNA cytosine methyltransferase [Thiothrix sp.]MDD5394906.1 DNA cytosine methyltransferase [Thiothrix sp.]